MDADRSITNRREWTDSNLDQRFNSGEIESVQVPEDEIWYVESLHATDMDDSANIDMIKIGVGAVEESEYPSDGLTPSDLPRGANYGQSDVTTGSVDIASYAYPGDNIFYHINAEDGPVDALAKVDIRRVA